MMEPSNNELLNKESYSDQSIYLTLNESIHVYNFSIIIFCIQLILFWISICYAFHYSLYILIVAIFIVFSSLYGFYTKHKFALYPLLSYYLFISISLPILSITITIASVVESTTGTFSQKNITIFESFNFSDNLINLIPLNVLLFLTSLIYFYKFNVLHRCIDYCDIAKINNFDQIHNLKPSNYSGASELEKIPILIDENTPIGIRKENNFTIVEEYSSDEDCFDNRKRT
uniref:Uncharacterized protein n=1 Tax=Strongyloides venezuelensis TaxID=75913 RepID=A0A0K0FL27_STRVS